jgi:hypothetical protein
VVVYRALVESELDVPKHLARGVHKLYFNPRIEEFSPRTTTWSLFRWANPGNSEVVFGGNLHLTWWIRCISTPEEW